MFVYVNWCRVLKAEVIVRESSFFCFLEHSVTFCARLKLDNDMRPISVARRHTVASLNVTVGDWLVYCRANFRKDFRDGFIVFPDYALYL